MNNPRLSGLAGIAVCALLAGCFGGTAPKARPEVQTRAEALVLRAVRAEQKGDVQEAEQLLAESLRLSASIEDNPATARARINLARLYRLRNDTARARETIDGALALLGTEADSYGEAAQEKALIELTTDSGVALAWAHKAVTAERGSWGGRRLNLLGRIQVGRGDLTTADATLKKALEANRGSGHAEEEANSLRMLGIVARGQQRLADAGRLLNEALEIDKRIGVSVKIGTDLEELALTARSAGDLENTAGYLERACDVHLNGGRAVRAATDLTTLAEVFGKLGNPQKEEEARKKAQQIAEQQTAQQPGTSPQTTRPSSSP